MKLISRYPRNSIRVLNLGWENIPSELQILDFQETPSLICTVVVGVSGLWFSLTLDCGSLHSAIVTY